MADNDSTIASMAAAGKIQFRTTEPYWLGKPWTTLTGFADIPVIGCTVLHRRHATIVPIVRQHVYQKLMERGLPYNTATIDLVPTLMFKKKLRCIDQNPSSKSYKQTVILAEFEYIFHILDITRWTQCGGKISRSRIHL